VFQSLLAPEPQQLLAAAAGAKVATVFEAASLAQDRRHMAVQHLERLRAGVPASVPMVLLPELFTRSGGRRVVSLMAEALHDELDHTTRPEAS